MSSAFARSSHGSANRKGVAAYAAFALLSAWIIVANYGASDLLIGGDPAAIWADPTSFFVNLAGIYYHSVGLGYNGSFNLPALFPMLASAAALQAAGLGPVAVQRVLLGVMFFLTFAGEYKLLKLLLEQRVSSALGTVAAFFGALLFGVNAYVTWAYSAPLFDLMLAYAAMPWVAYGVAVGAGKNSAKGIALLAFAFAVGGGCATNLARFGILLATAPLAALWLIADGAPFIRTVRVTAAGMALGLLACAWWALTIPTTAATGLHLLATNGIVAWLRWVSIRSSFARLFKLDGATGGPDLPHAAWYSSIPGDLTGYLPIFIIVALFGRLRPRMSAALLVTYLAIVFLAKGVHDPLGSVYFALSAHVPGFSIFRSAWDKWLPLGILPFATLFGISLAAAGTVLERADRRQRALRATVLIGALATAVYSWPAFAGAMLRPPSNIGNTTITFITHVPPSYYEVARILRAAPDTERAVIFNSGKLPYAIYTWGYTGLDPLLDLARNPITNFPDVASGTNDDDEQQLRRVLTWLDVRYAVVHRDVLNVVDQPAALPALLRNDARRVYHSTELDVYELSAPPGPMVHPVDAPLAIDATVAAKTYHPAPGAIDLGPNLSFRLAGFPNEILLAPNGMVGNWPVLGLLAEPVADSIQTAPNGEVDFLAFDPGARFARPLGCASGAAYEIETPTAWFVNGARLSPSPQTICSRVTKLKSVAVGSPPVPIDPGYTQFAEIPPDNVLTVSSYAPDRAERYHYALPQLEPLRVRAAASAHVLTKHVMLRSEPQALAAKVQTKLGAAYPVIDATDLHGTVVPAQWSMLNVATRIYLPETADGVTFAGTIDWWTAAALSTSSAYRFAVTYKADVNGVISGQLDGRSAPVVVNLLTDGQWHHESLDFFPDSTSSGVLTIEVKTFSAGTVAFRDVGLRELGPNGLVFTRTGNPDALPKRARITSSSRPFPWAWRIGFDGCSPCLVGVNLSDAEHWLAYPGRILTRFTGPGASDGVAGGSSAFEVDAGRGMANEWLVYEPALLFVAGFAITLAACAGIAAVALRARREPEAPGIPASAPRAAPRIIVRPLLSLLALSAITCDLAPEAISLWSASIAYVLLIALAGAVLHAKRA